MSSMIELHGVFEGLEFLANYLNSYGHSGDGIEEEWLTSADSSDDTNSAPTCAQNNVFADILLSVSSMADVVVLARDLRAVVVAGEWDGHRQHMLFHASRRCILRLTHRITCVLCVPVTASNVSGGGVQPFVDWTCVIIGDETGALHFYTQDGWLLCSYSLSSGSVMELQLSNCIGTTDTPSVTAVYSDAVVVLDATSLIHALTSCRTLMARVSASDSNLTSRQSRAPQLKYSRILLPQSFQQLNSAVVFTIADSCCAGGGSDTMFDRLYVDNAADASLLSQHAEAKDQRGANAGSGHTTVLTTGDAPYIAVFRAAKSAPPRVAIVDVVRSITVNIERSLLPTMSRSVLPSISDWLMGSAGGGKSGNSDANSTESKAEFCFQTRDPGRSGRAALLSRDLRWTAIMDSLGRVALFDNCTGVVVRLLKGYRDAECAWLEVRETKSHALRKRGHLRHHHINRARSRALVARAACIQRRVSCLVVYSPRRGLLDVYSVPLCSRVACFEAGKLGRLVGLSGVILKSASEGGAAAWLGDSGLDCVFCSASGQIFALKIPFHVAASDGCSGRAQDRKIIKQLSACMPASQSCCNIEDISALVTQLATISGLQQALQLVVKCPVVDGSQILTLLVQLDTVACRVRDSWQNGEHLHDSDDTEDQHEKLLLLMEFYAQLARSFISLSETAVGRRFRRETGDKSDAEHERNSQQESMGQYSLGLSQSLATLLNSLIESGAVDCRQSAVSRVTFAADDNFGAAEFLSCFDAEHFVASPRQIRLNAAMDGTSRLKLGRFLFAERLSGDVITADTTIRLDSTTDKNINMHDNEDQEKTTKFGLFQLGISCDELLEVLVMYWLDEDGPGAISWHCVLELRRMLLDLCLPPQPGADDVSCWKTVVSLISECSRVERAFVLAAVSRNVCLLLENNQSQERVAEAALVEREWETMSGTSIFWDLLLHQLADVRLVCVTIGAAASQLSLSQLLRAGSGGVSELLASWMRQNSMSASDLSRVRTALTAESANIRRDSSAIEDHKDSTALQACMRALAAKFEHSVHPDSVAVNCAWHWLGAWKNRRDDETLLLAAVDFVECVENVSLKMGICLLVWSLFLREHCSSFYEITESGGPPSKETCDSQLELPPSKLPVLLESSLRVLEMLLECGVYLRCDTTAVNSDNSQLTGVDELWTLSSVPVVSSGSRHQTPSSSCTATAPPAAAAASASLVQLCQRKAASFLTVVGCGSGRTSDGDDDEIPLGAVDLHVQALLAMRLNVCLDVWTPARHCFPKQLSALLFRELSMACSRVSAVDKAVVASRRKLLLASVAKAAHKVLEKTDGQADSSEANRWVSVCLSLVQHWGLDSDLVQHKYVVELFANGHDQVAHEDLDKELYVLAGSRLRYFAAMHWNRARGSLHSEASQLVANMMMPLENYCVEAQRTIDLLKRIAQCSQDATLVMQINKLIYTFEPLIES